MARTGLLSLLSLLALSHGSSAINILMSNDDGWASAGIRAFYTSLKAAGHNVLLVAPAENQSGRGGLLTDPEPVGSEGGEFGSIPPNSPAVGQNASDPNLWYVNATPASSVRFALQNVTQGVFGGPPDLLLTGVNAGSNLGLEYLVSGTIGAAKYGNSQGIPSVAFSAANDTQRSYTTIGDASDPVNVYASLATEVVTQLISGGAPYLPSGILLNVNFPNVDSSCATSSDFTFIQTRLLGTVFHNDACLCGQTSSCKLPTESSVIGTACDSSISAINGNTVKPDASAPQQTTVNGRLEPILSCLDS